ncbi:MAG: DUF4905 domain-containing protein [Bacteroidia bacterium]|nr:DUF4905 domain-containing protein [Bacteroidia bacterium]
MNRSETPKSQVYQFEHPIWKVIPDPATSALVIETRNPDTQDLRAFVLIPDQLSLISISLSDSWWHSLTEVYQGIALWQRIEDQGLPMMKGLSAYEMDQGTLAWQLPDHRLLRLGPEVAIVANDLEPQLLALVDWQHGNIRDTIDAAELPKDVLDRFDQYRHRGQSFPQAILPEDEAWLSYSKACEQAGISLAKGPISVFAQGAYSIIHAYNGQDASLQAWLLVLQGDQAIFPPIQCGIYEKGFTLDPFFVMVDTIVWLEPPHGLGRLLLPGLSLA